MMLDLTRTRCCRAMRVGAALGAGLVLAACGTDGPDATTPELGVTAPPDSSQTTEPGAGEATEPSGESVIPAAAQITFEDGSTYDLTELSTELVRLDETPGEFTQADAATIGGLIETMFTDARYSMFIQSGTDIGFTAESLKGFAEPGLADDLKFEYDQTFQISGKDVASTLPLARFMESSFAEWAGAGNSSELVSSKITGEDTAVHTFILTGTSGTEVILPIETHSLSGPEVTLADGSRAPILLIDKLEALPTPE